MQVESDADDFIPLASGDDQLDPEQTALDDFNPFPWPPSLFRAAGGSSLPG